MPKLKHKPIPPMAEDQIKKFWDRVEKRGPDECWPWLGLHREDGYGILDIYPYGLFRAIRVALCLSTGVDPGELDAMHDCENRADKLGPTCTNPSHLIPGTNRQNMQYVIGKKGGITDEQCIYAHASRSAGESVRSIAKRLGRSEILISHITNGRFRKRLGLASLNSGSGGNKLTADQLRRIHELGAEGRSHTKIAQMIGGVSQVMVSRIIRGASWAESKRSYEESIKIDTPAEATVQ